MKDNMKFDHEFQIIKFFSENDIDNTKMIIRNCLGRSFEKD